MVLVRVVCVYRTSKLSCIPNPDVTVCCCEVIFSGPVLMGGLPCYLKQAICNCLVTVCFPWVTGFAGDPFAALWRCGSMHHAAPCSPRAWVSSWDCYNPFRISLSHLSWSASSLRIQAALNLERCSFPLDVYIGEPVVFLVLYF